jgi:DNA-binding transcriptional MocR family regulator
MQILRPVGRQASSRKYDLITALGVHACRGDKHLQRLVLRFITAIVARYNWQTDELSIGQRELAALWSVDERTVKRDIAKLRALGWLVQKRAAVRGRVAIHGLDLTSILATTEPDWPSVGPDFVDRMRGPAAPAATPAPNVVAFPGLPAAPLGPTASAWDRALARLQSEDPAQFAMWYRQLGESAAADGILELTAPSRFHAAFVTTHHLPRLLAALRREDASFRLIKISAD